MRITGIVIGIVSFFLSLSKTYGQAPLAQSIDSIAAKQIRDTAPGLAIGIVQNGKVIFERYYGYANLQHLVPVDEKSRFNLASVSKQFTALCIVKLALAGKINLNDDIRLYLPGIFPRIKTAINIKQLLTHSSGIRDFYDLMSLQGKPWWRQEGLENADAIDLLKKQQALNFEPGASFLYSNSNYTLLTAVVEKASGMPFADYAKLLFVELGMQATTFCTNYMAVIPFQALPYSDWGDGVWQQYPNIVNLNGDGFLYTTLKDQLIFEQAIQQAFTTKDSLLSISQQAIKNSPVKHYGFGLELDSVNGYASVHHSGSTGSYTANTLRFPGEAVSIVVMSNNGTVWSEGIAKRVARLILPVVDRVSPAYAKPASIPKASNLKQLAGRYRSDDGELINIGLTNDSMYWQIGNNNPCQFMRDTGNLFSMDGNRRLKIAFFNGNAGKDYFMYYDSLNKPTVYKKIAAFNPGMPYLRNMTGSYYSAELDCTFHLKPGRNGKLVMLRDKLDQVMEMTWIAPNEFFVSDYDVFVDFDRKGNVKSLLFDYNRVKHVRFEKIIKPSLP